MRFTERHDVRSWGRVIRGPQRVGSPRFRDQVPATVSGAPAGSLLAVGGLRSYGDSVLNTGGGLIDMTGLDRLIAFDAASGVLRAEAGVTLDQILRWAVPLGYFAPVTPGTRFVTLGGAIANDVHGKNHHRAGTFGRHVRRLRLVRSDGAAEIAPDSNHELFAATVGGLGLTGVIEWAELQLQPIASAFVDAEVVPYADLAEFWRLAEASVASHEHTVAWIDCTATAAQTGRGVFMRANWSPDGGCAVSPAPRRLNVPLDAPSGLLNARTLGLFNRLYALRRSQQAGRRREPYAAFFYPLDSIGGWNRLYGRDGFWQYQCVVPPPAMRDAVAELLGEIALSGEGSFLAVLKTFGDIASPGLMSFPMPGATLALDFPNRGESTLRLLDRLDQVVKAAGGRLYAAKDGRIPRDVWTAGYPNLDRFTANLDPAFASDFWRRVSR